MNKVPSALKSLREKHGLTQDELAKELNLSKSTISMYESGDRIPRLPTMELLADYFNVNIDVFQSADSKKSISDDEIKFALFDGEKGITDEQYEEVKQFAKFVKERDEKKGK